MESKENQNETLKENVFQTEISHDPEEMGILEKNIFKQKETNQNTRIQRRENQQKQGKANGKSSLIKVHEKFKPEIKSAHIRRTPTPSNGTRQEQENDQTPDTSFLKFLTMRTIARRVRKIQINRQLHLNYTGNETIEHKFRKFKSAEVEPVLLKCLEENLEYLTYDHKECSQMSLELSEELRDIVKSMKYPRYKFVAMVTIGQKHQQTVNIGSRSVWNEDTDTYVTVTYTNETLFAVAMIFATLFE